MKTLVPGHPSNPTHYWGFNIPSCSFLPQSPIAITSNIPVECAFFNPRLLIMKSKLHKTNSGGDFWKMNLKQQMTFLKDLIACREPITFPKNNEVLSLKSSWREPGAYHTRWWQPNLPPNLITIFGEKKSNKKIHWIIMHGTDETKFPHPFCWKVCVSGYATFILFFIFLKSKHFILQSSTRKKKSKSTFTNCDKLSIFFSFCFYNFPSFVFLLLLLLILDDGNLFCKSKN